MLIPAVALLLPETRSHALTAAAAAAAAAAAPDTKAGQTAGQIAGAPVPVPARAAWVSAAWQHAGVRAVLFAAVLPEARNPNSNPDPNPDPNQMLPEARNPGCNLILAATAHTQPATPRDSGGAGRGVDDAAALRARARMVGLAPRLLPQRVGPGGRPAGAGASRMAAQAGQVAVQ